jgi:two-component system nitrogen regulation response regulator NtrX
MAADILIVDDEADIRELIGGILEDEGYEARLAADSDSALAAIADRKPSMVVLDIWLQGSRLDGLELLEVIKERHADLSVVIISGHGNIETAVSAIKRGAYDYIEKPFKADRLVLVVGRALENSRLRRENEELRGRTGAESELIGNSPAMRQLRATLKKVAPTNSRVLIIGAMGSGGVHRTGALEEAHGGTLYIDEVADMPVETQGKVVRALVEQTFLRVGGSKKVRVDVRIVSSTSRDLEALIAQGRFREDLFHRLSVVPVRVPSLSERREDIVDLVEHFVKQYSVVSGQPRRTIAQDALAILQMHEWPGNVRQLRNNVERLLILVGGDAGTEITAAMMPADLDATIATQVNGAGAEHLMAMPLRDAREAFERDYLAAQLGRFGNNISKTAAFVGMERSALHRKLKLLGIGASARAEDGVET